jgi:hypothetical protein
VAALAVGNFTRLVGVLQLDTRWGERYFIHSKIFEGETRTISLSAAIWLWQVAPFSKILMTLHPIKVA